MSLPPRDTPFSDVIGFEGIKHGAVPKIVNNLDLMGYGFKQGPSDSGPGADAGIDVPQPKPFSLDF